MNLVIDQGNTRTKYAYYQNGVIVSHGVLLNEVIRDFNPLLNGQAPDKAIICSVKNDDELKLVVMPVCKETIVFNSGTPVPIQINYLTPETLGLDRVAAAVGARSLSGRNACLAIDAGTALTFELIDEHGTYLGGRISPGLQMRFNALSYFTDKLPVAEATPNTPYFGNTTLSSIEAGVVLGIISEIEGAIDCYSSLFKNLKVYLTGGDALYFEKKIKRCIFADLNLVLCGLNRIIEYNAD